MKEGKEQKRDGNFHCVLPLNTLFRGLMCRSEISKLKLNHSLTEKEKSEWVKKRHTSGVFDKKSLFICGERRENLCCKLWSKWLLPVKLRNHFNVLPKSTAKCNLLLFKYPSWRIWEGEQDGIVEEWRWWQFLAIQRSFTTLSMPQA